MRRSLLENDSKETAAPLPSASPAVGSSSSTTGQTVAVELRSGRRIVAGWLLVAFWAGLIWMLGGDDFSLQDTNQTMSAWFGWLIGDLDYRTRYKIYFFARKSAHFIEYAILALLTFRAAVITANRNRLATAGWAALFLVATVATADEARQTFSQTRTGSAVDVIIDVTGGLIAIVGVLVISRRMRSATTARPST
ncbi:MAG: hypothetical protein CL908_14690 [Deltaproteobacteria bacterium]|nr:hypothetical protein [Deltaproteobacteria bacterium]